VKCGQVGYRDSRACRRSVTEAVVDDADIMSKAYVLPGAQATRWSGR
jgi:hypothetical protein